MASNQTESYGLNQWAAEDPVLRADFNADNSKVDSALAKKYGTDNPYVVEGSYEGTYLAGSDNLSATVTLGFRPSFVIVLSTQQNMPSLDNMAVLGTPLCHWLHYSYGKDHAHTTYLTFSDTGFTVESGFNKSGIVYHYFAFR